MPDNQPVLSPNGTPQGGPVAEFDKLTQRLDAIAAAMIPKDDHTRLETALADVRTNVETLRQMVLDRGASLPGSETEPFSYSAAISALDRGHDPDDFKRLAPREWEMSEATRKRMRDRINAQAHLVTPGERDMLNTMLDSEGGFLVPVEKLARFYDIFWAALCFDQLGVTKITPRGGRLDIVKGTGAVTAYDVFEGSIMGLSHSNPTFGIMELRPREIAVLSSATQRSLALSDPAVDLILEQQMAQAAALLVEKRCLIGSGQEGQARGLFYAQGGTEVNFPHLEGTLVNVTDKNLANGANIIGMLTTGAYTSFLDFETTLMDNNVPVGEWCKLFSHHSVKQRFRQDPASQYALPVPISPAAMRDLIGYDWVTCSQLPTTLNKSTYTGDGTKLRHFAFGDFRDMLVAIFGGYQLRKSDVAYNPITSKSAFFGRLVHFMGTLMYDTGVIRKESIVASNEVYVA